MRLPPRRTSIGCVWLCLPWLVAGVGCSSQKTMQPWDREQVETLPLKPEWQRTPTRTTAAS